MDFLLGFVLKSILDWDLRADFVASQPHVHEYFFDTKRGHSAQAQLHLKCPIGRATSSHHLRPVLIYLETMPRSTHFTYTHTRLTPR